jgi:hypothetical protein
LIDGVMMLDHDGAGLQWRGITWDYDGAPATSSVAGDNLTDVTSYFLNHYSKFILLQKIHIQFYNLLKVRFSQFRWSPTSP